MPPADTIHRHPHALAPSSLTIPVSFLVTRAEFNALRRLAVEAKVSRSELIRRLIADAAQATA